MLLSDSHGKLNAPLLNKIARLDTAVDLIVHAGDVGNADVITRLSQIAPVIAVAGNNDTAEKWPASDTSALARLRQSCAIELPGGTLCVVHGHQWVKPAVRHQGLRREFPGARVVVYGHSHRYCDDRDLAPRVLNPGACGHARAYGGPSAMRLSVSPERWRIQRLDGS